MVGPLTIARTPTDIFPNINIPVVSVIWNYSGLSAEEMSDADRLDLRARADDDGQRHRAHRVAVAARHRRHQGLLPAGREDRSGGRAGDRRRRRRMLRQLPPGTTPPFVLSYNASTRAGPAARAVGQGAVGAAALRPRRQLHPHAAGHASRARRFRIPYGGKQPQIQVDLDPDGAAGEGARRRPTSSTRSARRT